MSTFTISNDGYIDSKDLFLLGSSTKRDDSSKIGMFGTGWKYALATLIREGIKFKIYSGTTLIDITVEEVDHRGINRKVICIDGRQTSITSDLGLLWKPWMAFRELASNAMDEPNCLIGKDCIPEDGRVTIIFQVCTKFKEILATKIFCPPVDKAIESTDRGYIFAGSGAYRKGILCNNTIDLPFGVNFDCIKINEDRLSSDFAVGLNLKWLLDGCVNLDVWLQVLLKVSRRHYRYCPGLVEAVKHLKSEGYTFVTKILQKLLPLQQNSIVLSDTIFNKLVEESILDSPDYKILNNSNYSVNIVEDQSLANKVKAIIGSSVEVFSGDIYTSSGIPASVDILTIKDTLVVNKSSMRDPKELAIQGMANASTPALTSFF